MSDLWVITAEYGEYSDKSFAVLWAGQETKAKEAVEQLSVLVRLISDLDRFKTYDRGMWILPPDWEQEKARIEKQAKEIDPNFWGCPIYTAEKLEILT